MTPATVALRRAWRASGLSIAQIAARSEQPERTVYRVMAGLNVRADALFAVAACLNVPDLPVSASTGESPRT
jgi:predicted transcriptional regulator